MQHRDLTVVNQFHKRYDYGICAKQRGSSGVNSLALSSADYIISITVMEKGFGVQGFDILKEPSGFGN
ncbi:hypothetical protein BW900_04605 [Bacillus mycoides]|uniref:Uncharacterized protein n=1 Tax=Bacillus mycoides TaxID=1405 RepID=A0A1S9TCP8_BACMY|nr:hypothetical protein BW900_04605 [Bacillus mycoides]